MIEIYSVTKFNTTPDEKELISFLKKLFEHYPKFFHPSQFNIDDINPMDVIENIEKEEDLIVERVSAAKQELEAQKKKSRTLYIRGKTNHPD